MEKTKDITYCYHTHTERCGHASGTDEEYVQYAIKRGIKKLGFSDHIFLPGINQPGMRGDFSELENYLSSINYLKEKYKNEIEIHVGFEAEYLCEKFVGYYKNLLDNKKIDYLILGQHLYLDEHGSVWYGEIEDDKERIIKYTDHLIKGIETGLFTYVAHPDLYMMLYDRWDEAAIECANRIIEASVKHNIPLEINLGHVYGNRPFYNGVNSFPYPFVPFWKLVAKSNAKVVIGFDSHSPKKFLEGSEKEVYYIIEKTGVKPIFDFDLYNL